MFWKKRCSWKFHKIHKKTPVNARVSFFNKVAGLCQSLFFNKVAGLRPATLFKKRLWRRCFPVNFVKFLRTPFLQNTSGRLLLKSFRTLYLQCLFKILNIQTVFSNFEICVFTTKLILN